jgi:hypothetical protein
MHEWRSPQASELAGVAVDRREDLSGGILGSLAADTLVARCAKRQVQPELALTPTKCWA